MRHQEALEARVDKTPVDITKLKPSELLALALEDLEWAEAHPRYTVDMARWHSPHLGTCSVCLAGSVMARTMSYPIHDYFDFTVPNTFGDKEAEIKGCFSMLDSFRLGMIGEGLFEAGVDLPGGVPEEINSVRYERDPTLFKRDMRSLVKLLQEHGL